MNILQEAESVVYGDREASYGHPYDDFSRTAAMWAGLTGYSFTPAMVGLMMICVKLSRETNKPKRDNLVDIAGYAATVDRVRERESQLT